MRSITKKPLSYEKKYSWAVFAFVIPWIIGTIFFFIIPVMQSFIYSISSFEMAEKLQVTLVVFEHYIYALTEDSEFLPQLISAIPPMLYQVPIIVMLSLFLAMIINRKFIGRTVVRTIFFLPIVIASGIVLSIINGDVVNDVMSSSTSASNLFQSDMLKILMQEMQIGDEVINFITSLVDNILNLLWSSGMQTLLFLSALQTIPVSMYEAAKIEGGTAWENFWKITFPMVSPTLLINVVYSIISSFNSYNNAVVVYINEYSQRAHFEYSSAMCWIYTLLMLLFVGGIYKFINHFVFYEV